jgi:enamine deaminase RidA (YjgF/YER057c/UK114 family)
MSHLKYYTYPGGEDLTNTFGYSQSVNINGVIEISGQGGWSPPLPLYTAEANNLTSGIPVETSPRTSTNISTKPSKTSNRHSKPRAGKAGTKYTA